MPQYIGMKIHRDQIKKDDFTADLAPETEDKKKKLKKIICDIVRLACDSVTF